MKGVNLQLTQRCRRAFSIPEIMIATLILALVLGGLLAMIIQSRRLTEGSIVQSAVNTIIQGYLEQMKNMAYSDLTVSPSSSGTTLEIPTRLDESTADPLTLSWGAPPNPIPAPSAANPTNAITNTKTINLRTPAVTAADTLSLRIWVWVQDLSGSATNVTNAKSITIIYTYDVRDGGRTKTFRNSIRSIRSVVPTY